MKEQILSLFNSVPLDHPLHGVVESKLLPEMEYPVTIQISDPALASDYKHFTGIYGRRYDHLTDRKIENYGLLESIKSMAAHPGKKYGGSIRTEHFQGHFWTDLERKKLLGLTLVAKQGDDVAAEEKGDG